MHETIIEVKKLVKSFAAVRAVDDVSFAVKAGSFFAFLGQNGAGKSTTINMLIGLLKKDDGQIIYGDNEPFDKFKSKIGVVFQNNIFDDLLSVEENLSLYASLYIADKNAAKERVTEIIELLNLADYKGKKFKTLSGGQKRKSEVARALLTNPQILFLDEPTTGLDPKTRIELWGTITKLQKENNMTVFLTTHYMEEVANADEVVIIHKGKIIANGSPAELKSKYSKDRLIITNNEGKTHIEVMQNTAQAIDYLHNHKADIKFFEAKKGNMDDVFLTAVGESIGSEHE